jgi:Type IV secretion system pilin/Family of unknown function (DUF6112)
MSTTEPTTKSPVRTWARRLSWAGAFPNLPSTDIPTITLDKAIPDVINALLVIAGTLAVIFIAISGFIMVTSNGNPAKVKQAREALLYAIIGLGVATGGIAIVNFVTSAVQKGAP